MKNNIIEALSCVIAFHKGDPVGVYASLILQALSPVCTVDTSIINDLAEVPCLKGIVVSDNMQQTTTNLKAWLFDVEHAAELYVKSPDDWLDLKGAYAGYLTLLLSGEDQLYQPNDVDVSIAQVDTLGQYISRDLYREGPMFNQAVRTIATALTILESSAGERTPEKLTELNRKITKLMGECDPEFNYTVWGRVNEIQAPK